MPNLKISELTDGSPAQTTDAVPVARSGANFRVPAQSIAALVNVQVNGVPVVNTTKEDFVDTSTIIWSDNGDGSLSATLAIFGGSTLLSSGVFTVNMSPGFATASDYIVIFGYEFPLSSPGILSIEYVSGVQFKVHSSSGTDASRVRYEVLSIV